MKKVCKKGNLYRAYAIALTKNIAWLFDKEQVKRATQFKYAIVEFRRSTPNQLIELEELKKLNRVINERNVRAKNALEKFNDTDQVSRDPCLELQETEKELVTLLAVCDSLLHSLSEKEFEQVEKELSDSNDWLGFFGTTRSVEEALQNNWQDWYYAHTNAVGCKSCFVAFLKFDCGVETNLTAVFSKDLAGLAHLMPDSLKQALEEGDRVYTTKSKKPDRILN